MQNTSPAVMSASRLCGPLHQDSCGQIPVGDFHTLNGSMTGVMVAGVYLIPLHQEESLGAGEMTQQLKEH